MSYERCKRCRQHCWDDRCACRRFNVRLKEDPDFESDVWATRPEDAAERWVESYDADSNEYGCVEGSSVDVIVKDFDKDEEKDIEVTGEAVPTYTAL